MARVKTDKVKCPKCENIFVANKHFYKPNSKLNRKDAKELNYQLNIRNVSHDTYHEFKEIKDQIQKENKDITVTQEFAIRELINGRKQLKRLKKRFGVK